jgi:hypothetical protein
VVQVEQDYGGWVRLGEAWETKHIMLHGVQTTKMTRNWRWERTCTSSSMFECAKCGYGYVFSHIVGADPRAGGRERLRALRTAGPPGFVRALVPKGVTADTIQGNDLHKIRYAHSSRPTSASLPLYMRPPKKCFLSLLNDDALYEVLSALPSETLLSFCAAYPRAHDLMSRFHILLLRELRCFFLRRPLVDCVLGIGVNFDADTRVLSSDFDWLSQHAFDAFSVRRSIRKSPFEFFLPLAFSRAHFARVREEIWRRLVMIDDEIQRAASRRRFGIRAVRMQPYQAVRVIYQFMNNVVVSLVQSTNAVMDDPSGTGTRGHRAGVNSNADTTLLLASERAVISYCQLYHLLLSLAASDGRVLGDAARKLQKFLAHPKFRSKTYVPDMGELIVMASLVLGCTPAQEGGGLQAITWRHHLNGPLLEEVFVRNVRWTLKDYPELEILEEGTSEYRLEKTFQSAKTALRCVLFLLSLMLWFSFGLTMWFF